MTGEPEGRAGRRQLLTIVATALVVGLPLLLWGGFGHFLYQEEIQTQEGECGQYWRDGTNDWELCAEFGIEYMQSR